MVGASEEDRVRLEHVAQPESGAWVEALPSPLLGTILNNEETRIAVSLRLGLTVHDTYPCKCGRVVDLRGHHALSCVSSGSGKIGRHAAVNDLVLRGFRQAGLPASPEPRGMSAVDGKRPDGKTHAPLTHGKCVVWDVTIRDTYASSYREMVALSVGSLAAKAESEKRAKYSHLEKDYRFIPFVIETSGVWGKDAIQLIRELGRRIALDTGETRATAFLRQRISLAVQRGNAHMILEGAPDGRRLDELHLLH